MKTPRTRNRFAGQGDSIRDSGVEKWVNVFGDVQVIQNLARLKDTVERSVLRKAIAKGLIPVRDMAKRLAPQNTGLLKKSIKIAVSKMVSGKVYVDPKVESTVDGERHVPAKIAHILEFGGPKHKNPTPFMRPAMDMSRQKVLKIIEEECRKEIAKIRFA